jgi:hypothetical protein
MYRVKVNVKLLVRSKQKVFNAEVESKSDNLVDNFLFVQTNLSVLFFMEFIRKIVLSEIRTK